MDVDEPLAKRSLKAFERQARDLIAAHRTGDPRAFQAIRQHHPRLPGRANTNDRNPVSDATLRALRLTLADARCIVARRHAFQTWAQLARHIAALRRSRSSALQFETAVEAIVTGDEKTLGELLGANSKLVRARSTREHHATLLHYVGANAVEGYRQKTPTNAVRIAQMLLAAGAEVDADLHYGSLRRRYPERSGSTTLGMVATSVHPAAAGVQIALLDALLRAGASLDGLKPGWNIVRAALANGRPDAAEFLAVRGARLDLESAAGVGRGDAVDRFVDGRGRLMRGATRAQLHAGFLLACGYGHAHVVEQLMRKGVSVKQRWHGETPLHAAAYGGHADIVRLLLRHGADVHATEPRWHGTPLGWALHGWDHPPPEKRGASYHRVVEHLVAAGAREDPQWLDLEQAARLCKDERMRAALGV